MTLHNPESFARPPIRPRIRPRTVAAQPSRTPEQNRNPIPLHRAETLTQGGTLANIELSGQIYALRITRAGKLILTK